ncbi:MAG: arsenate reductase ArsC [Bacteroidales bacterium]|nr:arsenate reductase ArsC [Bacteroidales bacterium]
MKILILCTDNAIRSQMAEGFLKSFDPKSEVFSAGTAAAAKIHPQTVEVMKEAFINLTENKTKHFEDFVQLHFDCIITLCEKSKEALPHFAGKTKQILHFTFDDPASFNGEEEEELDFFRNVRDEIKNEFFKFYIQIIKKYTHE